MSEHSVERRVAYARRPGGPEVLQVDAERLLPPKSGEVLLRVEAVGLNHVESLIRADTYKIKIPFPYAAGVEGAGVAVAAGPGVDIAAGTPGGLAAVVGSCAPVVVAPPTIVGPLPGTPRFSGG